MSAISRLAAIGALLCAAASPASATVLTFDDLTPNFFTTPYQGFSFGNNDLFTNAWFHNVSDNPGGPLPSVYQTHSGKGYVAVDASLYDPNNPDQATMPISSATAFRFDGAWFSGGDAIRYQLFNGLTSVALSASTALSTAPVFVSSGYAGLVTSVVIYGRQGYYILDDFTFTAAPAAVPEPESLALLLGGFGVMGAFVRRRKRAG